MATEEPKFALYVSSVEGRLVSRYGAGTRRAASYIGARREARDPTTIVWETELVVALTAAEVARFGREYERAIAAKALRARTREEWLAQIEREREPAVAPGVAPSPQPAPPANPPTRNAPPET